MSLETQATLAKDETFRGNCEIAMMQEAESRLNAAQASGQSKPEWTKTTEHARRVVQKPDQWLDQFVKLTVADESVTNSDSVIKARATTIWDAFAGVSWRDAR